MSVRERLLFDFGWRFYRGDIRHPQERNYMGTYHAASARSGRGGAAPSHDDSDWEIVDLPHDFVIRQPPAANENEDHGYLGRDNGWYRNYFHLRDADRHRRLSLCFEGVATHCIVWVNGVELYRNFTAGIGFEVDFTDVACFGEEVNVISVYIDNTTFEGWYYEGGGIYRHVWLLSRDLLSVEENGVFINPQHADDNSWHTHIDINIYNASYNDQNSKLIVRIFDPAGRLLGYADQDITVPRREHQLVSLRFWIVDPPVWSLETPLLCTAITSIEQGGKVIDEVVSSFGYRTLRFDPDNGLFLNQQPVKIKGMCVHQEHGSLGVAIPDGVLEYRVRRLKEMGCNAIRTAHNPPASALLDICDRLGLMVMDENRWFDSSPQGLHELNSMLVRDRNHPCVIMWSMLNEEHLMTDERGPKIMNVMREFTHQADPSRPVTFAQNAGLLKDGVAATADIIGINYNNAWYPILHEKYPDRMLFGAETIGYINGRLNEVMDAWNLVCSLPYHGGIFAWTGFDYRGEAHWPDVFFRFGTMDPGGYAKDGFYLYQSYWTSQPVIHITTTWKTTAEPGSGQEVRVFTNGVRAELFADNISLGAQDVDPAYQARWNFAYRECLLEAVAYDNHGHEIARTTLDWLRQAQALQLVIETSADSPVANRQDVIIMTAYATDQYGDVCERAAGELVRFSVNGPVQVLGVGDGDARDYEIWNSLERRIRRGHCQLILRVTDQPGKVTAVAESDGLGKTQIEFSINDGQTRPLVQRVQNLFLPRWYRSPVLGDLAEPSQALSADISGWVPSDTADCQATHATEPGGCIGFYTDTVIPSLPTGTKKVQLVFEMMEFPFIAKFEPQPDHLAESFFFESKNAGPVRIDLPDSYEPGTKLRIRIGTAVGHGGQYSINANVRWHFLTSAEREII